VKPVVRRCAIYTRKSTEEGLDQAFNSLDAQREACEAYIKSQAHDGWKLVKGAYDDGGFSGGNMERPGLQRLMAEMKQGLIDIVVVYKVDRLTRSLAEPFGRGALYHLLRNRLYRGEITHKGQAYPGQHPAIVQAELWDEVQQTLAANRSQHLRARAERSTHLLAGRLRDDAGNPMIPTYSRKANGQQYRYYVSQGLLDPAKGPIGSVTRVPAEAVERLVEEEFIRRLSQTEQKRWQSSALADRAERLRMLVAKVIVREREIEISLSDDADRGLTNMVPGSGPEGGERVIKLPVAVRATAGGKSIVTLDGRGPEESRLDRALLRAVARANHWRELLETGAARSAYDLARREGCRVSYVQRHLPLAFLAPDIVEAILAGRQPRSWMLADLVADQASMSWAGYRPA
jgi:hypothetical protein